MTDKCSRDLLDENDENHSSDNAPTLIGSYRTSTFFELYNNQHCIKSDLTTRKPRSTTDSSFNRSEEDEESNLNDEDDDLTFDDLDDLGREPRPNEADVLSSSEEDEQDDKFDEDENNENDEKLGIPIHNQRFRKERSNSRTIHEDELSSSMKQYAKSLPVNIPNFKPFATNGRKLKNENDADNLDWVSFVLSFNSILFFSFF